MGSARCSGSAPTAPGDGGTGSAMLSTIASGARWCGGRPRVSWPPEIASCGSARSGPAPSRAAATPGRVHAAYEADQLAPLLGARTRPVTRTEETPLWDQPAALVLFFALLTIEWVARKRLGLP